MAEDRRLLGGEKREGYLEEFTTCLKGLESFVESMPYAQQRAKSFQDYPRYVIGLSQDIRGLLSFFSYDRNRNKAGIEDVFLLSKEDKSIEICRTFSGYPTAQVLRIPYVLKEQAESQLAAMPEPNRIVEEGLYRMFDSGQIPREHQELIIRHDYFKRLSGTKLPDFNSGKRVQNDGTDPVNVNAIIIKFSNAVNLFNLFSMNYAVSNDVLEDLSKDGKEREVDDMRPRLDDQNSRIGFLHMNNYRSGVIPYVVDRMTIGPFFSKETNNSDILNAVFNTEERPFCLSVKVDATCSMKLSTGTAVAAPLEEHNYMICPFTMKKKLESMFDVTKEHMGYESKVVGITDAGDIVD